jgi:hypothetical protein
MALFVVRMIPAKTASAAESLCMSNSYVRLSWLHHHLLKGHGFSRAIEAA